jgi:hypothetical protein
LKKSPISSRFLLLFFLATLLSVSGVFSQQNELHWVKTFGGTYADLAYDVKVDSKGAIYLLCSSGSPLLKLDSIELTTPPSHFADKMYLAAKGQTDEKEHWRVQKNLGKGVLIKLNPAGKVLWSLKLFSNNDSTGTDPYKMLIDHEDNLLITGLFVKYFSEERYTDQAFLSKISSDGHTLWTQKLNLGQCKGVDLGLDKNNNIFLLGNYRYANRLVFSKAVQLPAKRKQPWSAFIARFTSSGEPVWARRIEGENYSIAKKIKVDSKGDVYCLLEYNSPSLQVASLQISNQGGYDLALGKFDGDNGELIWLKNIGSPLDEIANSLEEYRGQIVVIGYSAGKTIRFAKRNHSNHFGNSFLLHLKSKTGAFKNFSSQHREEGRLYITAAEVSADELYLLGIVSKKTDAGIPTSHLELYKFQDGVLENRKEINIEDYDVGTAFTFAGKDTILLSGYFEYPLLSSEDSSKKAYFDTDFFLLSCHFPQGLSSSRTILPFKADSLFYPDHSKNTSERSILIYPNPSSDGNFTLRIDEKLFGQNIHVKVRELGGKLVLHKTIESQALIKISDLSSGAYLIQLEFSDGSNFQEQVIVL